MLRSLPESLQIIGAHRTLAVAVQRWYQTITFMDGCGVI
jgi:hypothetical protein